MHCEHTVQVLQKICWFVVLAAASSDQITLLNTTAADKKLEVLPAYTELLQAFITKEARYLRFVVRLLDIQCACMLQQTPLKNAAAPLYGLDIHNISKHQQSPLPLHCLGYDVTCHLQAFTLQGVLRYHSPAKHAHIQS